MHIFSFEIDIWWINDDGGFAVLIVHIMCQHNFWRSRGRKTRVLVPTTAHNIGKVFEMKKTFREEFHLTDIEIEIVDVDEHDKGSFRTLRSKFGARKHHALDVWIKTSQLVKVHSMRAELIFIQIPEPSIILDETEYMMVLDLCSNTKNETTGEFIPTIFTGAEPGQVFLTFGMN